MIDYIVAYTQEDGMIIPWNVQGRVVFNASEEDAKWVGEQVCRNRAEVYKVYKLVPIDAKLCEC